MLNVNPSTGPSGRSPKTELTNHFDSDIYEFLQEMDEEERIKEQDKLEMEAVIMEEISRMDKLRENKLHTTYSSIIKSSAMLGDADEVNRKKPFEFLSNIFKRRREHDENESDVKPPDIRFQESDFYNHSWVSDQDQCMTIPTSLSPRPMQHSPINFATSSVSHISSITSTPSPIRSSIMIATAAVGIPMSPQPSSIAMTMSPSHVTAYMNGLSTSPAPVLSSCSSPILIHQTPLKSRDIGEDMEAIRLSRQDNPYLQKVGGSRTSLIDEESPEENCQSIEENDTVHLVSHHHHSHSRMSEDSIISLSEVHEHLIRSPPPTSVPKIFAERGIFIFPGDVGPPSLPVHPGSAKSISLNPLLAKGHEDVLDPNLRQVLDTQRKLSTPKAEISSLSCSVPGSPARVTNQSLPLQIRKSSHCRTHSEEVPALQSSFSYSLAPVQPPGKKHPSSNEVLLNRPLLANTTHVYSPTFTPPLKPVNRNNQSKRSSSIRGSSVPPTSSGSSSSLTLPIKCPHQPAISKIT